MVDNNASANIYGCLMQATEVAVLISDRAHLQCGRCTFRCEAPPGMHFCNGERERMRPARHLVLGGFGPFC